MKESENLKRLFDELKKKGTSRAAFARKNKLRNGKAMNETLINQHIKGDRPISLDYAYAYASGFGLALKDISPSNYEKAYQGGTAVTAEDISNIQNKQAKVSENTAEYVRPEHENWLEEIKAIFDAVSETDKAEILTYARYRYDVSSKVNTNKKGRKLLHGLIELPDVRTYDNERQDKGGKEENS